MAQAQAEAVAAAQQTYSMVMQQQQQEQELTDHVTALGMGDALAATLGTHLAPRQLGMAPSMAHLLVPGQTTATMATTDLQVGEDEVLDMSQIPPVVSVSEAPAYLFHRQGGEVGSVALPVPVAPLVAHVVLAD